MINFIRTNSDKWNNANKDQYNESIVFIEDKRQIWSNNILYETNEADSLGLDKVEFDSETLTLEPDKFYYCNSHLELLDIELVAEEGFTSTYFLEFICDNTCVILPSNIKWENGIVPDFTQTAIMTIKIQDDTAYLIDCRPIYLGPCVIFTAEEANSSIGLEKLSTNQTLEYSTDTTTWSNMDTSTTITLQNVGDEVYIRGVLSADNINTYTHFKMSGKIAASGNCNALWNYEDLNAPLKSRCGYNMFRNCTSLTTAPELPAMVLAGYCYDSMFGNCTSLTVAPELPATTLSGGCYYGMFYSCASLTVAPELPATTLASQCYKDMFYNCTSLTVAPELPATTLDTYCYEWMLRGCTKLNYIKCLALDISASKCTSGWVDGVSSTGTFVKHPNMNSWKKGSTSGIPSGWTVVDAEIA